MGFEPWMSLLKKKKMSINWVTKLYTDRLLIVVKGGGNS